MAAAWNLDFTQFKAFRHCEWKWYETYIKGIQRSQRAYGQKADVLTLGQLVHDGLHAYRANGVAEPSAACITQIGPSPECLAWAKMLLHGYVRKFPVLPVQMQGLEIPMGFPLRSKRLKGLIAGLAKVDRYFLVHGRVPVQMESGLPEPLWLEPGIWLHEYKTKDASKDTGNWIAAWAMCMQADFQMLAASEYLGQVPVGMVIDVLEKPQPYIQKKTCSSCKEQSPATDWPAHANPDAEGGGGFSCPLCGFGPQAIPPGKPRAERVPAYYRIKITRSAEQLKVARAEITQLAEEMLEYLYPTGERQYPRRATERCVDSIFGPCEYFGAHSNLSDARPEGPLIQVEAPLAYQGTKIVRWEPPRPPRPGDDIRPGEARAAAQDEDEDGEEFEEVDRDEDAGDR